MKCDSFGKKAARCVMIALLVAGMGMLCGCWDNAEINGRAFVLGFGADRADGGGYDFTFQLAVPVSGESESSGAIQYVNCTVKEYSPAAAVRILQKNIGRQVNFEQLNIILVGEELARENFLDCTEYFFRRASVRRQSSVAVCGGSAKAFFSEQSTGSSIASDASIALQSFDDKGGADSVTMNLHSLFKIRSNRDEFYLLKILAVAPDEMGPSGKAKPAPEGDARTMLCIDGAFAYGRDGTFRGELVDREVELLRLLAGQQVSGLVEVRGKAGNTAYYQMKQSDCEIDCGVVHDVPVFTVKLHLVCVPADVGDWYEGDLREAERRIQDAMTEELMRLADRSRAEWGASVLGLQDALRQRWPDWYEVHEKQWESLYGRAVIHMEVDCIVNGEGVTR